MAQSAGSPGLSTHTPTPSAKQAWSALVLSLSWFQPRVGLAPWSRTQADGVCREEAKGAPIPAGGGVVACWERHFPDNDPSKKHKEGGRAVTRPLRLVK